MLSALKCLSWPKQYCKYPACIPCFPFLLNFSPSTYHHLICSYFMSEFPSAHLNTESRKARILVSPTPPSPPITLPLHLRVAGHKQTLSILWMKNARDLQSTRQMSLFRNAMLMLILIPDTRSGKSLLRDCNRQTLAHRKTVWMKEIKPTSIDILFQVTLNQSPSSKHSLKVLLKLFILYHL